MPKCLAVKKEARADEQSESKKNENARAHARGGLELGRRVEARYLWATLDLLWHKCVHLLSWRRAECPLGLLGGGQIWPKRGGWADGQRTHARRGSAKRRVSLGLYRHHGSTSGSALWSSASWWPQTYQGDMSPWDQLGT